MSRHLMYANFTMQDVPSTVRGSNLLSWKKIGEEVSYGYPRCKI